MQLFPYKHGIDNVLATFSVISQRNAVQANLKVISFYWMPCPGTSQP